MSQKEATASININKLLEASGWRFFPEGSAPANIRFEPRVTIKSTDLVVLGDNSQVGSGKPGKVVGQDRAVDRQRSLADPVPVAVKVVSVEQSRC